MNFKHTKKLQARLDSLYPKKYKISNCTDGKNNFYAIKRVNENTSISIKTQYYTYASMNAFLDGVEKTLNKSL